MRIFSTLFPIPHPFLILLVSLFLFALPAESVPDYSSIEAHLNATSDEYLSSLIELLSIASISASPSHAAQVRDAATWLHAHLTHLGLEHVQLLETPLHPAVYADWLHSPSAPTVLIYAHYDVQPVDPEHLWTDPPFTPTVRDGRIYARGASDDKGGLMIPIAAVAAYLRVSGSLPLNVKLLIEGEEEIGSPNLLPLLREHRHLLRADFSLSADGGQIGVDVPGLCVGLRGSVALEVTVKGGKADLHSGIFGGGVQNPAHVLSHLLASLRDIRTGRVLVDGFYDDVDVISDDQRAEFERFPISSAHLLRSIGVNETVGEADFSFYERTWCRPSLEIVGMGGGFQGEGLKTVLPREASAKISARIVSSQSTDKVLQAIRGHLEQEVADIKGVRVEIKEFGFKAEPYKMEQDTASNNVASKVLEELYHKKPAMFRLGGSIPVMAYLKSVLGLETTMFGFGCYDENAHAPDEFGRLELFELGKIAYVRILGALGELASKEEL